MVQQIFLVKISGIFEFLACNKRGVAADRLKKNGWIFYIFRNIKYC